MLPYNQLLSITRNLAHCLSASIYAILDSNDFKTDALANTTTKCTEWMLCTYIGNRCSCGQNKTMIGTCQIPWAIFQQICVKWNHTGLPEDVQNQQRGQRMRMIHIVMMNIIHSDTDDNKVSECDGFQSCLPCLSNAYIIYSFIQLTLPSLLGHTVGRIILTWFSTLQNTHKCIDWSCHQPWSFDLTFWHVSQNTPVHLLTFVESSICHLTQWSNS